MRPLLLITLLIILVNNVQAQVVTKGSFIEDLELNKFEGKWYGSNGEDSLIVVLNSDRVYFESVDVHVDMILGWHKYVKQGIIVEDYLDEIGSSFEHSTFNGKTETNDSSTLNLILKDSKRDRLLDASFRIDSENKDSAVLEIEYSEGVFVINDHPKKESEKLPVPSVWEMRRLN